MKPPGGPTRRDSAVTVRKTPRRGGGGRPRDPLSRPGQARAAGATGSRVAQQSGNACGSAIDRAILSFPKLSLICNVIERFGIL